MSSTPHQALEGLFWEIMRRFEDVALQQYRRHVPPLATAAKIDLIERLAGVAPGRAVLDQSDLAAPLGRLLSVAAKDDADATLVVQGLVLEQLGQAIYAAVSANPNVSTEGRDLAALAGQASASVTQQVPGLLTASIADADGRFAVFTEASHDLLMELDGLGDGIDRTFGAAFDLRFRDIAGELVARAVPVCTSLGMQRRQVVSHLAGALMGF